MIRTLLNYVTRKLFWIGFQRLLTDEQYAKIRYRIEMNQRLNLNNPRRFTEKIQYIKLYDHRPIRKTFADRCRARKYVRKKIGPHVLIPLIGNYQTLTPQRWAAFPSQFVLKANHGSGMIQLVTDKKEEDFSEIARQTERWKKRDFSREGREWAYHGLPRTILAEKLLLDTSGHIPKDYKFFCFNGRVKLIQVDFDRFRNQKRNLYDRSFKRFPARLVYPPFEGTVHRPTKLDDAIEVAEMLADGINFVRVDLYLLEKQIYFGELTNYPGKGFYPFEPEAMERKIGSYLKL